MPERESLEDERMARPEDRDEDVQDESEHGGRVPEHAGNFNPVNREEFSEDTPVRTGCGANSPRHARPLEMSSISFVLSRSLPRLIEQCSFHDHSA